MSQRIQNYIENINRRYRTGISREHAYRGDLQTLLSEIVPEVLVINEPSRIACGSPDYILTKRNIPVGYVEAKDIDVDLTSDNYKEQFGRYLSSLDNIIFTDYLDFRLYVNGEFVTAVRIAEVKNGSIVPLIENFATFENLIKDFTLYIGQTIKSPKKLAEMMAGKARMLSDVIEKVLISTEENQEDNSLKAQMDAFKKVLINDISPKEFADIYAQTIAYGMFAARLHDRSLDTFTRQEASEQIPKTNPFLRKLFGYIAGPDIDDRIKWIVDSLADVFRATDVSALLKNFGNSTQTHDPVIHFYETFLSEYDPKLRKSRGVWYTPEPVVNFIVRAVDDILKAEFGLEKGLSDTSKIKIKVDGQGKKIQTEVHKVQILDPATGTGTFLTEVIKEIHKGFENQQGIWSSYVENHLIPRINGFELLMASYAMAHLKLDMLLSETGYKPTKEQRFRVYLTNSLEEYHPDTGTLFTSWLSQEANEANHVKRDTPVMVVLGNPPYSGESANKGTWIMKLMEDYKVEPNEMGKLKERNPKWINDDYVKFLRFGQHLVERNGEGIIAFINPHGFLDNPTFRGMRWNLLKTFDRIYTLDLHGNSKKKETAPDGTPDVNVFDIMQGVSINIFIKSTNKKSKKLGKVLHYDLFGKREEKYKFLLENSIGTITFKELSNVAPNYYFVPKDFDSNKSYNKGFSINELFPVNSVGVVTANDALYIADSAKELLENFSVNPNIEINVSYIQPIYYRPFDLKYIYYDKALIARAREKVMQHFIAPDNIGISLCKQFKSGSNYQHCLINNKIIESSYVSNKTSEITSTFPLYISAQTALQQPLLGSDVRKPNFNMQIVTSISEKLKVPFSDEKELNLNTFAPIDLLDYIYAVLYSPSYRSTYIEFLKIDFPRIPYPKNSETFWQLVDLGSNLRKLHLLELPETTKFITKYSVDGSNHIEKVIYAEQKVWINDTQYFDGVPESVWNFYIGGYQPAQKWLKDRKGRNLEFEDIQHYQKIIVALVETEKLMQDIDKIVSKDYLR